MKQLVRNPLLLATVLVLPLWVVFGNFIVAATVALLVAFFIAMCLALYALQRSKTKRL